MELHCIDYEVQLHAPRGAQSRARIPPNPTLAYEAEAVCAVAHRLRDEQQAAFRLAAVCLAHRHRASKFMPAVPSAEPVRKIRGARPMGWVFNCFHHAGVLPEPSGSLRLSAK